MVSGCSFSKNELVEEVKQLEEKNKELSEENNSHKSVEKLFNFYNKLSTETAHAFVLIESKHTYTLDATYADGVVIGGSGYYYYILADYNQLWVSQNIRYRIMNANAEVYNAELVSYNGKVYDEETGLVLLRARITTSIKNMSSIGMGDVSDIVATVSNTEQLNKIQLITSDSLDEYFYNYDNEEYSIYRISGDIKGPLVNMDNKLCGIYLSNLSGYASAELIKKVAYATYSLIL